ncbi:hypothetical protein FGO68_gene10135 [Halteria grandinella]|uniref:Uncharacterized protein n=1 Tax=Halteria grandinella TaxID=5974 RepID=A0A8J8NUI7_HALGN|nr:hypothetical protein FGO68_gene10135 [Halteria grandinella]
MANSILSKITHSQRIDILSNSLQCHKIEVRYLHTFFSNEIEKFVKFQQKSYEAKFSKEKTRILKKAAAILDKLKDDYAAADSQSMLGMFQMDEPEDINEWDETGANELLWPLDQQDQILPLEPVNLQVNTSAQLQQQVYVPKNRVPEPELSFEEEKQVMQLPSHHNSSSSFILQPPLSPSQFQVPTVPLQAQPNQEVQGFAAYANFHKDYAESHPDMMPYTTKAGVEKKKSGQSSEEESDDA